MWTMYFFDAVAISRCPRKKEGRHGSLVKGIWGHLGAILGSFQDILEPSWGHLGASWRHLGPSWGHPEPCWGHLGRVLGILSYLRAILGTSCARRVPEEAWVNDVQIFRGHFGVHFGVQSWPFWGDFGVHFLNQFLSTFWNTFGAILGTILGPDRAKKGRRWAQEGHQELQRPKILHLQKPKTKHWFFKVFGVQRPPKRGSRDP